MNNIAGSLLALSRIDSTTRLKRQEDLEKENAQLKTALRKLQTVIEKEKNDNDNRKRDTKTSKVSKSSKK